MTPDFTELVDLAAERLGGAALWANDEFFAEKDNLLKAEPAVFVAGKYTDRGKWMDGWETRRRRTPGHDWCIVRLGVPGHRAWRRGRHEPLQGQLPGVVQPRGVQRARRRRRSTSSRAPRGTSSCPRTGLRGDARNAFTVPRSVASDARAPAHLPGRGRRAPARARRGHCPIRDGSAARASSRTWTSRPSRTEGSWSPRATPSSGRGTRSSCPGRAHDMSDGWETRRTRRDGPEWVVVKLAAEGALRRAEMDTWRFRGQRARSAALAVGLVARRARGTRSWRGPNLLAHTRHVFDEAIAAHGPARYVAPLHLARRGRQPPAPLRHAEPRRARGAGASHGSTRSPPDEARGRAPGVLRLARRGRRGWCDARPYRDLATAKTEALRAAEALSEKDWLEAFAAHPRIGEKKSDARGWSAQEQSRVAEAQPRRRSTALAEANRAYEAKHGFVYLVCATGQVAPRRCSRSPASGSRAIGTRELAPCRRGAAEDHRAPAREAGAAVTSPITTHVLDTARGVPAAGVCGHARARDALPVPGCAQGRGRPMPTVACGRSSRPGRLRAGAYRSRSTPAHYFVSQGGESFWRAIVIEFVVRDATRHFHVPLLVSPFGYSTYRGS